MLPSSETGSTKAVHYGFTCRAVKWKKDQSEYCFNGRIGAPISPDGTSTEDVIRGNAFITLFDQRNNIVAPEEIVPDVPIMRWKFKDGQNPGIQRFLEGMGEIEPDEPDAEPEIPADAVKFMNRPNLSGQAQGRSRVPARAADVSDSSDEDVDAEGEQERDDPASESEFNDILMRRSNTKGGGCTDSKSHPEIKKRQETDEHTTPTIASLLRKRERSGHAPPTQMINNPPKKSSIENIAQQKPAGESDPFATKLTSLSFSGKEETASSQFEEIPSYTRKYANVDKVGLTSVAGNQAAWEHENPSPRKPKMNRTGITRRQQSRSSYAESQIPTSGSSAAMSLTTGPEINFGHQSPPSLSTGSSIGGPSTVRQPDTLLNTEPWVNNVVHGKIHTARMIDDTSQPSRVPVKPPPGLELQNGRPHKVWQEAMAQESSRPKNSDMSKSEALIDFDDGDITSLQPYVRLPTASLGGLLQPTIPGPVRLANDSREGSEDQIIERIKPENEDYIVKRNTMRQKKGKGQGSSTKKKKKTTPKAQLPLPDPVPPPKRQSPNKKPVSTSGPQEMVSKTTSATGEESSKDTGTIPPRLLDGAMDSLPKPKTAAEKLLQNASANKDVRQAEIIATFGTVLTRHLEQKEFQKGVFTKNKLHTKLREAGKDLQTSFLSRMTTSKTDARYLLELANDVGVEIGTHYEIHLKKSDGGQSVLTFDESDKTSFIVMKGDNKLGRLFLHYPMRVWDAQVTIDQPEIDDMSTTDACEFVFSIHSTGVPPSFLARVPQTSFSIERVYVKRTFTRQLYIGIEIQVTEYWELMLESVNLPNYNFKAVALPDEEMIEKQRLWFEFSVRAETADSASAARLQGVVDDVVTKIDGVGFGNKGPWEKAKVEALPEWSVGPTEWFW